MGFLENGILGCSATIGLQCDQIRQKPDRFSSSLEMVPKSQWPNSKINLSCCPPQPKASLSPTLAKASPKKSVASCAARGCKPSKPSAAKTSPANVLKIMKLT